ncbi:hypothetical protein LTR85_001417 [Meristemomyces frigidus]|nr:hypothetical protein LTR85_001417 [Meristemomyces frigidus]
MATTSLSRGSSHTDAEPVTAVYKNMTLTSPTVYIDFKTAYATNACGKTIGKTYPGAILGIDPHSLYSVQAQFDYFVEPLDEGEATSTFYQSAFFNFHNLAGLVPASVYRAQPSCMANGCYTIFNDYRPVLVLPSEIRHMDPAWKSCGLDWRGAWDPPIALHPAAVIDPVTTSVGASYTISASPHSTVSGPATQTAAVNGPKGSTSLLAKASSMLPISASVQQRTSSTEPSDGASASEDAQSQQPSVGVNPSASSTLIATSAIQITTTIQVVAQSSATATQGTDTATVIAGSSQVEPVSSSSAVDAGSGTDAPNTPAPPGPAVDPTISTAASTQVFSSSADDPTQYFTSTTLFVAGQEVSSANGGIVVGATTLSAGGNPVTVSGVAYSAATNGGLVLVSDSYAPVSEPSPTNAYQVLSQAQQAASSTTSPVDPAIVTDAQGSQRFFVPATNGGYVADGSITLSAGGTASVAGLGVVSAASDGVVITNSAGIQSTATYISSQSSVTGAVFTVSSLPYTVIAGPSGTLLLEEGGTIATAAQGRPVTFAGGQVLSVGADGNPIVAGQTVRLSALTTVQSNADTSVQLQAAVTFGSETLTAMLVTADPKLVQLGSVVLSVGGAAEVSGDHTISAASNGVVEDGTLIAFTTPSSTTVLAPLAMLTLSGTTMTAAQQSGGTVRVGSQLLVPGGEPATLDGHTISAAAGGIVDEGTTIILSRPISSNTDIEIEGVLTIGSSLLTAVQASVTGIWTVGGDTLSVGGSALVSDKHTISAASSGLVDNGRSVGFSTLTSTIQAVSVSLPVITTASTAGQATCAGAGGSSANVSPSTITSKAASARMGVGLSYVFVVSALLLLSGL